jgi:CRISPR/Cas system-associated exonuclease Cas4 (RecB family)
MISVSDLGCHVFCSRITYLRGVLNIHPEAEVERLRRHDFIRSLGMRRHILLSESESLQDFESLILEELKNFTCRHPHPENENLSGSLRSLASDVWFVVDEMGFEDALQYLTPEKTGYFVRSEYLGVSGVIDKIYPGSFPAPSDTKLVLSNFKYESDRVKLCCYGILLEEDSRRAVEYGFLEHAFGVDRKPIVFNEKLRESTLLSISEVSAITDGLTPPVCPHGNPLKCRVCDFEEICYVT